MLLSQDLSLVVTVTETELREVHTATQCSEWEINCYLFLMSADKVETCSVLGH